jgi:PAS domain S-box-containing protein
MLSVSSPHDTWFSRLLTDSFKRSTDSSLAPDGTPSEELASWVYRAPFCLLAQDAAADPRFAYANLAAQRLFGYSWQEFTGMPSRLSAGAEEREQRQEFMHSVLDRGYASGYRGRRVSKSGEHFWIEDTTVWNLTDADGTLYGQAALFAHWSAA